jgi:hypothetical protein
MKTFEVTEQDVYDVADRIHARALTDEEVEWILFCYEDAQRQDPTGSWNLVVENLIYTIINNDDK